MSASITESTLSFSLRGSAWISFILLTMSLSRASSCSSLLTGKSWVLTLIYKPKLTLNQTEFIVSNPYASNDILDMAMCIDYERPDKVPFPINDKIEEKDKHKSVKGALEGQGASEADAKESGDAFRHMLLHGLITSLYGEKTSVRDNGKLYEIYQSNKGKIEVPQEFSYFEPFILIIKSEQSFDDFYESLPSELLDLNGKMQQFASEYIEKRIYKFTANSAFINNMKILGEASEKFFSNFFSFDDL